MGPTREGQPHPTSILFIVVAPSNEQLEWCVQSNDKGVVWFVDTNACRWSALTNREDGRGIPGLSPLCDLADFYDPHTQDFVAPLGTYRFFEVMADVPARYPWRGNGLYTLEVVEYLLNAGAIAKHNVTRALQHALDIPTHVFVKADQQIMDALAEWGSSCFVFEKLCKRYI